MTSNMKVIIVSSNYEPVIGGAESQAKILAHTASILGVDVTVLTQPQPNMPVEERVNGVQIVRRLTALKLGPIWGMTYIYSTYKWLNKLMDKNTVIHNQTAYLHSIPSVYLGNRLNVPSVVRYACAGDIGDVARLNNSHWKKLLLSSIKQADRHIVLSQQIRAELLASGIRDDTITYRPNGVDTDRYIPKTFEAQGKGTEHFKLLFVGRFTEQKGLSFLLKALSNIQSENWSLDIYGYGPLEEELKELSRKLLIESKVVFHGVSDNMPMVYQEADLLVLPSLYEGMPNVVLEAMASGLPVIATDIGGSRELMEKWAAEWLVSAGNVSALTAALIKALREKEYLKTLGKKARQVAVSEYDYRQLTRQYIDDCEQLLSNYRTL
jgi:glycosyltransferase involved in cell wall biosynthesis